MTMRNAYSKLEMVNMGANKQSKSWHPCPEANSKWLQILHPILKKPDAHLMAYIKVGYTKP